MNSQCISPLCSWLQAKHTHLLMPHISLILEDVKHLSLFFLGKIQKAELTLNPLQVEWVGTTGVKVPWFPGVGTRRVTSAGGWAGSYPELPSTMNREGGTVLPGTDWLVQAQFATTASPLTALICKDQRNPLTWSEDCETVLTTWRTNLCSSPVLMSPDFKKTFPAQVDTSAVCLGAVLAQGDPGDEHPILYLNRKLQPCETGYSTVEERAWWWQVTFYMLPHIANLQEEGMMWRSSSVTECGQHTHTCTHTAYLSVATCLRCIIGCRQCTHRSFVQSIH